MCIIVRQPFSHVRANRRVGTMPCRTFIGACVNKAVHRYDSDRAMPTCRFAVNKIIHVKGENPATISFSSQTPRPNLPAAAVGIPDNGRSTLVFCPNRNSLPSANPDRTYLTCNATAPSHAAGSSSGFSATILEIKPFAAGSLGRNCNAWANSSNACVKSRAKYASIAVWYIS